MKDDDVLYSEIPKPPKGMGISRRLLLTIAGGLLLIVILFLYFINHYALHPLKKVSNENRQANSESAVSLIEKIQGQTHQPLLVDNQAEHPGKPKNRKDEENVASKASSKNLAQNDFKEASNAAISVYHNTVQYTENQPSTSSYPNTLNALQEANSDNLHSSDAYAQQNLQSEKIAFLKKNNSLEKNTIQSKLQQPISPYQLNAGTIIPANLVTGIHSNLPGHITARVRRDVYDTATGNYLLIPQGTTLIGRYDSQVAYGQARVLIVWSRLLFPDASSFDLQGMPGADLAGLAGLHDQVDNHYFRLFSSALMFSMFSAAGQLSQPQSNNNQLSSQQIIYGAIGQQMEQTATQLIAKNMNIQPTLKIRPGTDFNVLLTRDMVLQKPYPIH